jgi:hypothetical protein
MNNILRLPNINTMHDRFNKARFKFIASLAQPRASYLMQIGFCLLLENFNNFCNINWSQ